MLIGNAGGVTLKLNNEPVGPFGEEGQMVSVTLPLRKGIMPLREGIMPQKKSGQQ